MPSTNERMSVFAPIEREKTGKTFWLRLGSAFVNKDGIINVYLDAVPLTGKLQIRAQKESDDAENREHP